MYILHNRLDLHLHDTTLWFHYSIILQKFRLIFFKLKFGKTSTTVNEDTTKTLNLKFNKFKRTYISLNAALIDLTPTTFIEYFDIYIPFKD